MRMITEDREGGLGVRMQNVYKCKYFVSKAPPFSSIHERPEQRKIFLFSDVYALYNPDVLEHRGRVFKTSKVRQVGGSGLKSQFLVGRL